MNRDNVLKLIGHMTSAPDTSFNMGEWLTNTSTIYYGIARVVTGERNVCNTVGCIAGHATLAMGKSILAGYLQQGSDYHYSYVAQKWLDLTSDQANVLFTPQILHSAITKDKAIKVLQNMLDNSVIDWSIVFNVDDYNDLDIMYYTPQVPV